MLFIIWSMSSLGKWQMMLWSNNISRARNRKLWIEVLCVWIHARLHVQLVSWLWVSRCVGWVKSSLMNETSWLMKRTASLPLKHTDTNTLHMQHNMQGQPIYMMLKIVIFSLLRVGGGQSMELVRLDGKTRWWSDGTWMFPCKTGTVWMCVQLRRSHRPRDPWDLAAVPQSAWLRLNKV